MKRIVFYLSLVLFAGLLTGCSLLGKSGDPTANSKLQSLSVTGLYANGNQIVAATGNYIFLSVDNGSTWKLVDTTIVRSDSTSGPLPLDNLGFISRTTLFGNGSFIFAGVDDGEHGGILVSTDNGRTWTERDTSFSKAVSCFARIGNTFFAGGEGTKGIYSTTNNGKSWNAVDTSNMPYAIYTLAANGTDLLAGTNFNGIYQSANNGKNWDLMNPILKKMSIYSLTVINSHIFAGTYHTPNDSLNGILVSINNGKSWKVTNKQPAGALFSYNSDLFAGTNGATYFSTNEGNSWALLDSTTTTCFVANNGYLFEGTHKGVRRYPLSKFNK